MQQRVSAALAAPAKKTRCRWPAKACLRSARFPAQKTQRNPTARGPWKGNEEGLRRRESGDAPCRDVDPTPGRQSAWKAAGQSEQW